MNEREIFLAALEIDDAQQRGVYLDEQCAADPDVRARVEQLLTAYFQASQFLEQPAVDSPSATEQTLLGDSSADPLNDEAALDTAKDLGEAELQRFLEPTTRKGWLGRLAHYEVEAILGRGAFGIVAKAFDEKLHRVVAIKMMSPELATTSPPRKRFLREARTVAAVTHENIVAIHAVEEQPLPYLVMEYVPGPTLQQRMNQIGPLEVLEVLEIGRQVAEGLAAAHSARLIHRDIKPANILLNDKPNLRAKVSDFGLARTVDDASLTASGIVTGTPLYMSPEQARGEPLDHRSDLFSLGSVLYQMVSGRPPFRAPSTVAVLKRVCDDTPRPLDDVIPETPEWLEILIFKLLEKEPDRRFQTAREVADLLAECQQELLRDGKVQCVKEHTGLAETQLFQSEPSTKADTRRPSITPLIGTIFAIAVFVALVSLLRPTETPGPANQNTSNETAATATVPDPQGARDGLPADAGDHALLFDGPNQYVEETIGAHSEQPITIEAWVRFDAAPPLGVDDGQVWRFAANHHLKLETEELEGVVAPRWECIVEQREKDAVMQPRTPVEIGRWMHVAVVYTGDDVRLFQDGQVLAQMKCRNRLQYSNNTQLILGGRSNTLPFLGALREVRVSTAARYEQPFTPPTRMTSAEQTLVLYHCDAGHGERLLDASGRGNDGKIIGATWVSLTDNHGHIGWQGWPADAPQPAIAPFNAEQAKAHQEAWAKYLDIPVEYENSIGMKFRLIPPGEFLMGSTPEEIEATLKLVGEDKRWPEKIRSEGPQHKVILTQPVYVGATEVTQAQYKQVMGKNPSAFSKSRERNDKVADFEVSHHPVEMVSWNDAAEFCAKLSQQEQLKPFYFRSRERATPLDGTGYRLPTEAEWEYACRAGTTTRFWSGDEDQDLAQVGWYASNSGGRIHAVGELRANPFGLSDMHGNVWEWIQDSWDPAFYGKSEGDAAIDPSSPFYDSYQRVLRGGRWDCGPSRCRSSLRYAIHASGLANDLGFRAVLTVDGLKQLLRNRPAKTESSQE